MSRVDDIKKCNDIYLNQNFVEAVEAYTDFIKKNKNAKESRIRELMLTAFFNRSVCYLKIKDYQKSLSDIKTVITKCNNIVKKEEYELYEACNRNLSKALFNQGFIYFTIKNMKKAFISFQRASVIDGEDPDISKALNLIKRQLF